MKKLLTAHVTEKAYGKASAANNQPLEYTFKVHPSLNKILVKKHVEQEFNVHVIDVHIINLPGKNRKFKGISGRTSPTKKAIVRLKTGERIAAFDVDEEKKGNDKE